MGPAAGDARSGLGPALTALALASLVACSNRLILELPPEAADAPAFILEIADPSGPVILAGERGALSVDSFDDDAVNLHALTVPLARLGLRPGTLPVGDGRPLPIRSSHTLQNDTWVFASAPDTLPIEMLSPAECPSGCLARVECPDCAAVASSGCGECGPTEISRPMLPSDGCPADWSGTDNNDGHRQCSPDLRPDLADACSGGAFWNFRTQACAEATETCAPPRLPTDGRPVVYFNPFAPAGGDGSIASPFRELRRAPAGSWIIVPGAEIETALVVEQNDVHLEGHGRCTRLSGLDEPLTIAATGVTVSNLEITSRGALASVRLVATASATLTNIVVTSTVPGPAILTDGDLTLRSAAIDRPSECETVAACRDAGTVRVVSGRLRISDTEIRSDSGILVRNTDIDVERVRLIGRGEFGTGLSIHSGLSAKVSQTSLQSFGQDSIQLKFVGLGHVALRDLWIKETLRTVGRTDPTTVPTAIHISEPEGPGVAAELSRVHIDGGGNGVVAVNTQFDASDLSIRDVRNGILFAGSRGTGQVSNLERSWISYRANVGIGYLTLFGGDLQAQDLWIQFDCAFECAPVSSQTSRGAIANALGDFEQPQRIELHRVHLAPSFSNGISGFADALVEDLTVRGGFATSYYAYLTEDSTSQTTLRRVEISQASRGLLWESPGTVEDLSIELRNAVSSGSAWCQLPLGSGSCTRCALNSPGPSSAPILFAHDFSERTLNANDIVFRDGTIVHASPHVVGQSDENCSVQRPEAFEKSMLDRVQVSRP